MKGFRKSNVNLTKIDQRYDKYFEPLIKNNKNGKISLSSRKLIHKSDSSKENNNPNSTKNRISFQGKSTTKFDTKSLMDEKTNLIDEHVTLRDKKCEYDELKTSQIKVIARFRDENNFEKVIIVIKKKLHKDKLSVDFWDKSSLSITHSNLPKLDYHFDSCYNGTTDQINFYREVALPTIDDVLNGYNGTILTYGQSGSGKTYTMFGEDIFDEDKKGVIPRSIDQVFSYIDNDINEKIEFQLKFSILEIYKETLYDLLNPVRTSNTLKIKEDPKKGIYVENLSEPYVDDKNDLYFLLDSADESRIVNETRLNSNSSRSHIVFILYILQKLPDGSEKKGILNLIDLAGSERVTKTGAIGETLEEAKKINKSLSCLGNVINYLSSGNNEFIPYRESKLTRLLKDSLGGNFKTTLIVTLSPHVCNYEETLSSLNFAKRAKKIKNKVKINIKRGPEELEKIITNLQNKLKNANAALLKFSSQNQSDYNNTLLSSTKEYSSNKSKNIENLGASQIFSSNELIKIQETKRTTNTDEEILTLKDQVKTLKNENKVLKEKNKEINSLLNIDNLISSLEISVKVNIEQIEQFTIADKENNRIVDCLSNLNKNFSEYLDILEVIKNSKKTINMRNTLLYSNLNEGSINESVKRKFIKTISKATNKHLTSQELISNIISNKYNNDESINTHKTGSMNENEIKELCSNNIVRAHYKSRIPLPLNLTTDKDVSKKVQSTITAESINETIFPNKCNGSFNFFQSMIQQPIYNNSNLRREILISQASLRNIKEANEIRILKKEKRMSSLYVENLLEEIKLIQSENKVLVTKLEVFTEKFNRKSSINSNKEIKLQGQIIDSNFIDSFVKFVLSKCQLASKKIDNIFIKINDLIKKDYEIILDSGLNKKVKSLSRPSRNKQISLKGDLDNPEI